MEYYVTQLAMAQTNSALERDEWMTGWGPFLNLKSDPAPLSPLVTSENTGSTSSQARRVGQAIAHNVMPPHAPRAASRCKSVGRT